MNSLLQVCSLKCDLKVLLEDLHVYVMTISNIYMSRTLTSICHDLQHLCHELSALGVLIEVLGDLELLLDDLHVCCHEHLHLNITKFHALGVHIQVPGDPEYVCDHVNMTISMI